MKKRMKIIGGIIVGLVLVGICLLVVGQEPPKVTLRYKFNVGDKRKYECIIEREKDYEIEEKNEKKKNKYLTNAKYHFDYEVLELTPEAYWKIKLSATLIEGKGVSIVAGKKKESHYSPRESKYEEFLNTKGELFKILSETARGKKPYIFRQKMAKELGLPVPDVITNTNPLLIRYDDMIRYFRPVLPENAVGLNDTWIYSVALFVIPRTTFDLVFNLPVSLLTFNYKVAGFEKKGGFDCVKIEYNYDWDFSDKLNGWAKEEEVDNRVKFELKVKGSGTFYFAYNEGFLVYRKENLMLTDVVTDLYGKGWGYKGITYRKGGEKTIKRIGFTMNYIKP